MTQQILLFPRSHRRGRRPRRVRAGHACRVKAQRAMGRRDDHGDWRPDLGGRRLSSGVRSRGGGDQWRFVRRACSMGGHFGQSLGTCLPIFRTGGPLASAAGRRGRDRCARVLGSRGANPDVTTARHSAAPEGAPKVVLTWGLSRDVRAPTYFKRAGGGPNRRPTRRQPELFMATSEPFTRWASDRGGQSCAGGCFQSSGDASALLKSEGRT